MSLARGEEPGPALVIAVAATSEERERLVRSVDDRTAVLLVRTREEAVALLLGDDPLPQEARAPALVAVPEPGPPTPVGLTIDSDLRIASYDGATVPLSPLEHDLLRCLLDDVGHTWPFEVLHERIWGTGHLGGLADVQSVVKRLRRKLKDLRCPVRITSVRGVGLRLDRRPAPAT